MKNPSGVQRQIDLAKKIQTQIVEGEPAKVVNLNSGDSSGKPDQDVNWEHRFKTQKQKYDEVVPELRQKNESLEARVAELEDLVKNAKPVVSSATQDGPMFSPEEIEEYGADFLAVVERVVGGRGNQDTGVSDQLSELKTKFDSIALNQAKSAEGRFYEDLQELVPDWQAINDNDGFKKWLSEEMPLTGKERQNFLIAAQQALDARKVASFFTAWKGESGQQSYMIDTVNGGQGDGSTLPEGQIETEIISKADIKAFYDDKKLGRYRKNPEEARQIEMRIFRAQREGRVR